MKPFSNPYIKDSQLSASLIFLKCFSGWFFLSTCLVFSNHVSGNKLNESNIQS